MDESTGIERGGRGCDGVCVPGVAGGVKAGEMIEGAGSWWGLSSPLLCMLWLFPSCSGCEKSKPSKREGCGECSGGNCGDACAGRLILGILENT